MARREQALHLRYCEDFREFTEKVLRSPERKNEKAYFNFYLLQFAFAAGG